MNKASDVLNRKKKTNKQQEDKKDHKEDPGIDKETEELGEGKKQGIILLGLKEEKEPADIVIENEKITLKDVKRVAEEEKSLNVIEEERYAVFSKIVEKTKEIKENEAKLIAKEAREKLKNSDIWNRLDQKVNEAEKIKEEAEEAKSKAYNNAEFAKKKAKKAEEREQKTKERLDAIEWIERKLGELKDLDGSIAFRLEDLENAQEKIKNQLAEIGEEIEDHKEKAKNTFENFRGRIDENENKISSNSSKFWKNKNKLRDKASKEKVSEIIEGYNQMRREIIRLSSAIQYYRHYIDVEETYEEYSNRGNSEIPEEILTERDEKYSRNQ